MSVNDVLNKITERNSSVIGCIARKGDRIYHNLEAFDVDCHRITETIGDLLAVSDMLEGMDEPVNMVMAEYDGNCLVGQRVDGNLLVAVSDRLHRGGYKKLQVGLSLQARLLGKALDDMPEQEGHQIPSVTAGQAADPAARSEGKQGKSAWSRLLGAVVATAPEAPVTQTQPTAGKTKRHYRGQVYYD